MEKYEKLCARFSWETIAIPPEKYDNTVEITLLVLYLFLGIVGKYIVIRIGNHMNSSAIISHNCTRIHVIAY